MKIVISAVLAFFLIGCSSDDSKQVQNVEPTQIIQDADEAMVVQDADEERAYEDKEDSMDVGVVEDVIVAEGDVEVGAEIYKLCSTCHGMNAEKSALGKSKIIRGWDANEVSAALNGYIDGSYGGAMKGLMKAQASKLSDEDIEIVSEYISTL